MLIATSTYADGPMGSGQKPTLNDIMRRAQWVAGLGVFTAPVMLRAEHGSMVTLVDSSAAGTLITGDGLITRERDLPLLATHSDCLPIFLWDEQETICGLVHAGWRGIVAGVLTEALRVLKAEGVASANIRMQIGPHIGQCCFEIQEDVAVPLRMVTQDAVIARGNSTFGALAVAAVVQARVFGLSDKQIDIDRRCTACTFVDGAPLFSSYRRDCELARNMGSVIALT